MLYILILKKEKFNMKRIVILLLTILLTKIICFSNNISINQDSTVLITSQELKQINLIFVEHEKLREENVLLYKQINNYKEEVKTLEKVDSVRKIQITEIQQCCNERTDNLNKEIKKKNRALRAWQIGGVTLSVGLLIFLILK